MKLYTNSTGKDSVRKAFYKYSREFCEILIASPFFTYYALIEELLNRSCRIRLIIRLCSATSPSALSQLINKDGIQIRYFTSPLFHSKLYIFDDEVALVGSANLTDAGMQSNREICVGIPREDDRFDKLVTLFQSYWDQAEVLTVERLEKYNRLYDSYNGISIDTQLDNSLIEEFGEVVPKEGIQIGQKKTSKEKVFLESYRRTYQEFMESYILDYS